MNSRSKGRRSELELAHFLTDHGFPARRGQQLAGGTDSPDVVCNRLAGWHIECKHVERLDLPAARAQATRDAVNDQPIVAHRRGREQWLVTLSLEAFLALLAQPL